MKAERKKKPAVHNAEQVKPKRRNLPGHNLPAVALAGRPNVGKSTLFNRLLRKRRAITDPTPGVTRDPVEADCIIAGRMIRLIDTGGYKLTDCDEMDRLVVSKTIETLKYAKLIVLLLDAGDITSEDEELIKRLRMYRDKLIVAVNKTEGGRHQADAYNVMRFGFDNILMISAEHGDNIGELEQEIIKNLDFSAAEDEAQVFASTIIRIALLGKPNTGKSTLSNRLTATDASIVSDIPGTTRDIVEGSFRWKERDFILLDTAGIRRKAKVTADIEYYSVNRAIKAIDDADIVVLMIDAQEGLTDQDKKIAALAHDKGRGIIMALNKWDTMPGGNAREQKNTFTAVSDRIRFLFGQMEYAPIIPVSAKDGTGVDKLLSTAITMYSQLNITITTSRLNQALEKWLAEYPPPIGPRTRFKIKYAVQKSANPVHFIFFASRSHAVSDTYVSYLRNKIRKDLGFSLVPVLIDVKGR